jgi:uncharacterized protein (DUF983 family)
MTIKDKQRMYERFQSKMESACYQCINEITSQHDIDVPDTFIIDNVVPEVWEYLNKIVPTLASKHSKK